MLLLGGSLINERREADESPRCCHFCRRHEPDGVVVCTGNHSHCCPAGRSGAANFVGRGGPNKPRGGLHAWLHDDPERMPSNSVWLPAVCSQGRQTARQKMNHGAHGAEADDRPRAHGARRDGTKLGWQFFRLKRAQAPGGKRQPLVKSARADERTNRDTAYVACAIC